MRIRYKPWAKEYLESLAIYRNIETFVFSEYIRSLEGEVALEIGVGRGDYLKSMVSKFQAVNFIGVELNNSVMAVAAKKLVALEASNVVIVPGDALVFLPKLESNSVDYIILNHSDPWPKKKHEKRRLTFDSFMKEYYRVLKKGGYLLIKTDNALFAEYCYSQVNKYPFENITVNEDYKGDALFDAVTEYQTRFLELGTQIKRITGRK